MSGSIRSIGGDVPAHHRNRVLDVRILRPPSAELQSHCLRVLARKVFGREYMKMVGDRVQVCFVSGAT